MSNWNRSVDGWTQNYSRSDPRFVDFANLAYNSGPHQPENDSYLLNFQDPNNLANSSADSYGTVVTVGDLQELAFTQTLPFDHNRNEVLSSESVSAPPLPLETTTRNFGTDSYFTTPESSQFKLEAQDSEGEESQETTEAPPAIVPKRKRGRPKQNKRVSEPGSSKNAVSNRIPHNLVERKYRQMLNAEMERLREHIPTLPQDDGTPFAGPSKPSKATVLAAAVDYIKELEGETERLTEENEILMYRPMDH